MKDYRMSLAISEVEKKLKETPQWFMSLSSGCHDYGSTGINAAIN